MESTSKHGGNKEEDLNKTKSQFTDSNKNKALIKTQSNDKTNVFESIVSKDVGSKNLVDDLSGEQRASSVKAAAKIKNKRRPTPVTLAHVWGSKKNRKIKYDNLRVLIDTGCSDSLALFKYGRNKKLKEQKRNSPLAAEFEKPNMKQKYCSHCQNSVQQKSSIGSSI